MGLQNTGGLAIHMILSKLGPNDTAAVGCVSKSFRVWASEDSLWLNFCSQELNLSSPQDPLGNLTTSFKAAYQAWREAFAMYPWSLVKRVKRCWDRLKNWLKVNFPEAMATLRKGASEGEINELEDYMKVKLPIPTRVLYRFCDGQDLMKGGRELPSGEFRRSLCGNSLGLIGGYSVYDHHVNVFLLPLKQVIIETKGIVRKLGFNSSSKYIVVASSSKSGEKVFFLDCTSGQLHVGTRNLTSDGEMIPCVPNSLINLGHDSSDYHQQDAMLLWLEEHSRRLETGFIKLREEKKTRSINLFPEQAPPCSTAVTNGVQVRASSVFMPEFSDLQDETEKYLFSYSIRLSLLPEGCVINGLSFDTCQLYWRRWIIRADENVVSDVNGEAVIGKFPLLRPGEKEYVYQSCAALPSATGSIEGSFTFVPGRLAEPKGSTFEAEVAGFPLQLPDYVF